MTHSCKVINPSRMLRTGNNFQYDIFSDTMKEADYQIAPNDIINVFLYTKKGEELINPIGTSSINANLRQIAIPYTVESDSTVKLPILGKVKITGYTIEAAEELLEKQYSTYFNNPFIKISIINKRIIVFPGGKGSQAMVVPLENPNTTLFEALAQAGGINEGKAHKVKLIRGDLNDPEVYLIDLSTIEGIKKANLVMQANDIIYVEPRDQFMKKVVEELTPYLTLLSTILLITTLVK